MLTTQIFSELQRRNGENISYEYILLMSLEENKLTQLLIDLLKKRKTTVMQPPNT